MPKTYTATASGPANPNAPIPKLKGFLGSAITPEILRQIQVIVNGANTGSTGMSAADIAAAKKKKQQDENLSYKERLIAAARAPVGMKKGGAVKKKVTVKAKPVVKAKARKK